MAWKTVSLELARTEDFPEGSSTHAYVLRLPLDADGLVEHERLKHPDERPTVRRSWPNEHDRVGVVVAVPGGWAFSYSPGEEDDEPIFHLENHPIRPGDYLTITETDGKKLPFRVARILD